MSYKKLGRNSSARKALFRSILASFFKHERIETTEAKAKEVRSVATLPPAVRRLPILAMKKQLGSFSATSRKSTRSVRAATRAS